MRPPSLVGKRTRSEGLTAPARCGLCPSLVGRCDEQAVRKTAATNAAANADKVFDSCVMRKNAKPNAPNPTNGVSSQPMRTICSACFDAVLVLFGIMVAQLTGRSLNSASVACMISGSSAPSNRGFFDAIENSPGRCRGRGPLPTRSERLDQRHTRGKSLSAELNHTLLVRQRRRLRRDHIEVLFHPGLVAVVRDIQCALRRGQRRMLSVELLCEQALCGKLILHVLKRRKHRPPIRCDRAVVGRARRRELSAIAPAGEDRQLQRRSD